MVTETSASGHPKASKILCATFRNAVVPTGLRLWRFMIAIFWALPGNALLLVSGFRVIDPVVIDSGENLVEAPGYLVQVFQGQLALVELTVDEDVVDDLLHQPLDPRRGRIGQGPGGRLHAIGQK